jgi:membrane protease YdiL (CAAX protease family)
MLITRKIDQESLILLALFPHIATGLLNGLYYPGLITLNPGLYWLADVFHFVAVPALCCLFLSRHGVRPRDYGFRSMATGSSWAENCGLILFVTFIFWLGFDPISNVLYRIFWESAAPIPFSQVLPEAQPWRWLVIFYAALTAGLIEEAVFRSLPWLYCSRRFRAPELPYVLISSSLFGLVHWEQGIHLILAAGFLGILSSLLYITIRNIWPFVIAHFVTDMWSFHGF